MAEIIYGDDRYPVPDGMARHLQDTITAAVQRGITEWIPVGLPVPVVEAGEEEQHVIVELLIGPGIPLGFVFTYETSDDLEAALTERAEEIRRRAEERQKP